MDISRGVSDTELITSRTLADKIIEAEEKCKSLNEEFIKPYKSMISNLTEYLQKVLEYEEKERICGPNRNSYYKTDHDVTAMCLKSDYYSGLEVICMLHIKHKS